MGSRTWNVPAVGSEPVFASRGQVYGIQANVSRFGALDVQGALARTVDMEVARPPAFGFEIGDSFHAQDEVRVFFRDQRDFTTEEPILGATFQLV